MCQSDTGSSVHTNPPHDQLTEAAFLAKQIKPHENLRHRGETKMESNEKQASVEGTVESAVFRIPASLAEAYETGFRWKIESFAHLECWRNNSDLGAVKTREGLALFRSNSGESEIVIPFVATYEFGTPRQPKYPYSGGSVCLIDDDEEHAATLERRARVGLGKDVGEGQRYSSTPEIAQASSEEIEKERVSLWLVSQYYKRTVVARFKIRGTKEEAEEEASGRFGDGMGLSSREIKNPKRRLTKKSAKRGSRVAGRKLKMQTS
jgi:hypothetical protein